MTDEANEIVEEDPNALLRQQLAARNHALDGYFAYAGALNDRLAMLYGRLNAAVALCEEREGVQGSGGFATQLRLILTGDPYAVEPADLEPDAVVDVVIRAATITAVDREEGFMVLRHGPGGAKGSVTTVDLTDAVAVRRVRGLVDDADRAAGRARGVAERTLSLMDRLAGSSPPLHASTQLRMVRQHLTRELDGRP